MKRVAIVIFLIPVLFLWSMSAAIAQFSEAGVQKFSPPVDAADFTLKELGGRAISLKELKGKVILLKFFHTW